MDTGLGMVLVFAGKHVHFDFAISEAISKNSDVWS